jgi:hypothetical protein
MQNAGGGGHALAVAEIVDDDPQAEILEERNAAGRDKKCNALASTLAASPGYVVQLHQIR